MMHFISIKNSCTTVPDSMHATPGLLNEINDKILFIFRDFFIVLDIKYK